MYTAAAAPPLPFKLRHYHCMGFLDKARAILECLVVFRKIGNLLMIVAVLLATGTHWMVLQSIAWTGMLAENLQTNSLSKAIVCTFDGKHPCCICKEIAKRKQSERKSDLQMESTKLEFPYSKSEFVFCPPSAFREMRAGDESGPLLTHAPPVPPPRPFFS